jgi:hypothetical protein
VGPIDEFADVLSLSNGSRFVRGDLHVHSIAGSHDVSDATATPEALVAEAIQEGLSILAIADHNEISGVAAAINAAKGSNLLVVPATELSTAQGHLLCYLPDLATLQRFHAQLTVRDAGTGNSRVENSMIDCLNRLATLNGFAILAHVDAPKGLDREVPGANPHKIDIVSHAALLAIELKNSASDITFGVDDPDPVRASIGRERAQRDSGTLSPLARVLNSDSHTLNALGRNARGDQKVTRYKVQGLTFESLRYALMNADARVRLEDALPEQVPTIRAIRLTGCFLREQAVHFSSNLTCIIGGRGTGKSTMFEALRFFSPTPSNNSVVNSDVWPDRIDIAYQDQAGRDHHLSTSKGDVSGICVSDPLEGPETMAIECYGQGETQQISQRAKEDPAALLAYLDRFTGVRVDLSNEEQARSEIFRVEELIREARGHVSRIPQVERDLAVIRGQIKKYTEGHAKEIIETSQQLEAERVARAQIVASAKEIAASLNHDGAMEYVGKVRTAADPIKLVVGKEEFAAITLKLDEFEKGVAISTSALGAKTAELEALIHQKIQEWASKEKVLLAQIQTQKAALESQGISVNTAYIAKLTKDEAESVTTLADLRGWQPKLTKLEEERDGRVTARWAARSAIAAKRKKFATAATKKLRSALADLNVTLKFDESGYSPSGHELLVEVMGWRTTQVPRATLLTQTLTVPKLVEAIRANNPAPIQALKTPEGVAMFSRADADEIIKRFQDPDKLARLQTVPVVDRPKLTVTRPHQDDAGNTGYLTREFSQLSLGQQQSVLLALMLSSDSVAPLLIDQPEDNLDSEFIYSQLVPVLRLAKERRQIIVITHNANIAVLGDAEQVVVLKATSERSRIQSRGSIDDSDTKEAACAILEGARTAFVRRGKVYGVL